MIGPAERAEMEKMLALHDLTDPGAVHDDLVAESCTCGRRIVLPPNTTGDSCASCGGMTVRTGSCATCTQCGTSGGCG